VVKVIGGIAGVIALAAAAFTLAYFGGGLLTKADPVEPAGAALRAPQLAVAGTKPVAMQTPTATPTPKATPKAKKRHKKKQPVKRTPTKQRTTAAATTSTQPQQPVATATRVPVYTPPARTQTQPKKKSGGNDKVGIIIED
jgi:hypothetical protein